MKGFILALWLASSVLAVPLSGSDGPSSLTSSAASVRTLSDPSDAAPQPARPQSDLSSKDTPALAARPAGFLMARDSHLAPASMKPVAAQRFSPSGSVNGRSALGARDEVAMEVEVLIGRNEQSTPQIAAAKIASLKQLAPVHHIKVRELTGAEIRVTAPAVVNMTASALAGNGCAMDESDVRCSDVDYQCCGQLVTPENAVSLGVNINPVLNLTGFVGINCVPRQLVKACQGINACCHQTDSFYGFGCVPHF